MKLFMSKEDKLHKATKRGNLDDVIRHLQDGADVNAKDKDGNTPLYYATLTVQKDVAELLIDKSADVNAKASDGCTPLHAAARCGHKDLAELLKKHGAVE